MDSIEELAIIKRIAPNDGGLLYNYRGAISTYGL